MTAKRLDIQDRHREHVSEIASLDNFEWVDGDETNAKQIITNPNISLYCLDDARQEAIFVVLPDGINLSRVPFVYQAQFENAEYLIAVPYLEFLQLADTIKIDASKLIYIHNIGRCGSTLLSQALNEVEQVIALSEPDVFSNFITIRHTPRDQQIRLLQACYKWMFRPAVAGNATRYVLKLRNQCVDIMEIYATAFPQAKHLFMYRNGIDWIASLYRLFINGGNADLRMTLEEAIHWQAGYLNLSYDDVAPYFDHTIKTYTPILYLAIGWQFMMKRYVETVQNGFHAIAIRYEDLTANRDAMLSTIFAKLDLPESAIQQAQKAFERDSQEGTKLAREDAQSGNTMKLTDAEMESIMQLLAKQPVINRPDVILSGTLSI